MAQILQFVRPDESLDPETLKILGEAYDRALASLHDAGQPIIETIARRMLELASKGERDPERLCQGALSALGSRL